MAPDLRTLFVLEPPDTGLLDSFVSHRLFEAGIWESPGDSDGIEQIRVVECEPARLSLCGRIFHIDQTLHWFWLDLVLANSGTKIGWTLHFDFVSGSSRRDRDAIYLSHRADDVTWRVVLTGDGKIRDGKVVVASRENFSAPQQGIRGQPMEAVTDLERAVLLRFLEGDDPVLRALRDQLAVAEVREREFTGVGFFTYFLRHPGIHPVSLPDGVLNPPLVGDVELQAENLRYGVGFVLFVKDGLLHFLEGYTKGGEPWPDDLGRYVVRRDAVPES